MKRVREIHAPSTIPSELVTEDETSLKKHLRECCDNRHIWHFCYHYLEKMRPEFKDMPRNMDVLETLYQETTDANSYLSILPPDICSIISANLLVKTVIRNVFYVDNEYSIDVTININNEMVPNSTVLLYRGVTYNISQTGVLDSVKSVQYVDIFRKSSNTYNDNTSLCQDFVSIFGNRGRIISQWKSKYYKNIADRELQKYQYQNRNTDGILYQNKNMDEILISEFGYFYENFLTNDLAPLYHLQQLYRILFAGAWGHVSE